MSHSPGTGSRSTPVEEATAVDRDADVDVLAALSSVVAVASLADVELAATPVGPADEEEYDDEPLELDASPSPPTAGPHAVAHSSESQSQRMLACYSRMSSNDM